MRGRGRCGWLSRRWMPGYGGPQGGRGRVDGFAPGHGTPRGSSSGVTASNLRTARGGHPLLFLRLFFFPGFLVLSNLACWSLCVLGLLFTRDSTIVNTWSILRSCLASLPMMSSSGMSSFVREPIGDSGVKRITGGWLTSPITVPTTPQ